MRAVRIHTPAGHSTGGGEVAHYIGRHGESRVARAVLISSVPPLMLQTPANPRLVQNGTLKTYWPGCSPDRPGSGAGDVSAEAPDVAARDAVLA
jgi:pimeloyl-ACP methyl ester carboxylesterase